MFPSTVLVMPRYTIYRDIESQCDIYHDIMIKISIYFVCVLVSEK